MLLLSEAVIPTEKRRIQERERERERERGRGGEREGESEREPGSSKGESLQGWLRPAIY